MSQSAVWKSNRSSRRDDETINFTDETEAQKIRFKVANYVPSKYQTKYIWYIGSAVLAVLLLIVIVISVKKSGASKNEPSFSSNDTSPGNASPVIISNNTYHDNLTTVVPSITTISYKSTTTVVPSTTTTSYESTTTEVVKNTTSHGDAFIFVLNGTDVVQYHVETGGLSSYLQAPSNSKISSFVIHGNGSSYWIENLSNATQLVARVNGTRKVLLNEGRFKPNAIAVDEASGIVYATDKNLGILVALSMRNRNFTILLTDLDRPHDLALDSKEGLMFILNHSYTIVRANMDGTNITKIVSIPRTSALTIDTTRKRLYWVNDLYHIDSSDYYGENRRSVVGSEGPIAALTISKDELLWTERRHKPHDTLFFCEIHENDDCVGREIVKLNYLSNVVSVRGYNSTSSSTNESPCGSNNGGCEQICLLSGRNRSTCTCSMGWELNPDNRTCHQIREFVLYPHGDVVRTCDLNGTRDLFWPTPYKVEKLDAKSEISFEYDLKNDDFYFSDDHHIYTMKLKSYSGQKSILSTNSTDMIIEDIAYDWLTGNLLYSRRHADTSKNHSLVVFSPRLGEAYQRTLRVFEDDYNIKRSYAIAVHPSNGFLFGAVSFEEMEMSYIFRAKINQTAASRTPYLHAQGVKDHRFFAVDYTSSRLYEVQQTDGKSTKIAHASFDRYDMEFIEDVKFTWARTVSLHGDWLYLGNSSSIYRFDKDKGGDGVRIAPRVDDPDRKIVGVKVVSEEVQMMGLDNPCAKNNGGCEQFCFIGSKARCKCRDGQWPSIRYIGRCI